MMDFNLILLLVGLGLLAIVILFALWGFLGGLKRELACIGVFAVLLVLAWLVFGNSGVLLNYSGGLVDNLRDLLNLPAKDATVWESALDYLRSLEGLNLDKLLVEGKETYNLIYNISSAVATMVLLIVSTLVVVIITPIIRLISHIVMLIIRGVKKRRARKRAEAGEEEVIEEEVKTDEEFEDAVLVLNGSEGSGDAVITLTENELPAPKKTKKRIWGALAGALKGLFLIILLFVPISGIYSVARVATPETRELISDLVNGDTKKQSVAESEGITDIAFDFVDAYEQSAVGKFVEGSSYFFGKSFSTLLFDSISKINTDNQTIKLREELSVFIETVNQLNGSIELGSWTQEEVANALGELKDSKLLPEVMPVAIEFLSVMDAVSDLLAKAPGQEVALLKLRDIDWDSDLELILDAVVAAYQLDIFPLEDFNYLTMDPEVLSEVVSILGDTQFLNQALPIAVKVGVKVEALQKIIGNTDLKLAVDNIDWKEELLSIVDIYDSFQEFGYESLDELTDADLDVLVDHLVDKHFDTTVKILDKLAETRIFGSIGVPVLQAALNEFVAKDYSEFANIINLNQLTVEDWKNDFKAIVEIAKLASSEINALSLKLDEMDIESPEAIQAAKDIVAKVFSLKLLGDDDTKNALIHAVFEKFDLFNEEDLFVTDASGNKVSILDGINWVTEGDDLGEIEFLQNLIDVYADFIKLEDVDIHNFKFDFAMLDKDETVDVIVDALETLVDSELVIAVISPAVNKYVLPITNEFDDDNLVQDIVGEIGSETAAHEIINIVKAFKSASKLGLFQVPEKGLAALNYTEVDAIKDVINVVFDSKLFEGYEGRIIRIIFKATKLLDVEKGLLNDINYDGEQEKLIAFIDEVTPILLDPNFKLTNDEGKVQLDLNYFSKPEIAHRLLNAVAIILGTYERQSDGTTVEVQGSILVETLLPSIYSKYLKDLIPAEFKELVDIIDIENLPGGVLASDIRRIVYIADQLVLMDVQGLLVGEPLNYVASLQYMENIIDALLNIKMFGHCGNEVFAWVINYVSDKVAPEIIVDDVTAEDFANVDWALEGENAKQLINDLVAFLNNNKLTNTEQLIDFINNKEYQTTGFVNKQNANELLDVMSTLLNLQTIEVVLPIVFNGVMEHLANMENAFISNVWGKNLTGAQLVSDLRSIIEIGDRVVNETDFIGYWQEGFDCEIVIPEAELVVDVLHKLFSLNLIVGYEADLLEHYLGKLLPESFIFSVEDLGLDTITNWTSEFNTIEELVSKAIEVVKANGFDTVQSITEAKFNTSYITDKNVNYVAEILDIVAKSDLIGNILPTVFEGQVLPIADKQGFNVDFLNDLTKEELVNDIKVIANILRTVQEVGVSGFFTELEEGQTNLALETKSIEKLIETAQKILVHTRSLNIVTKHEADLTALLVNKILELAKITDFTIEASEFENVDWESSASKIVEVLGIAREFAKSNNLVVIKDFMNYLNDVKADINVAITDQNAEYVSSIIQTVASADSIVVVLPIVVEYGIDKAVEAGFDISFLEDVKLTNEEIAQDVINIALIVIDLVRADAIDIYKGLPLREINEDAIKGIATKLGDLNLINHYANEWNAFLVNFVLDKVNIGFETRYEASQFAYISSSERTNDAQLLGNVLVDAFKALNSLLENGLTIDNIKEFVSEQKFKHTENLNEEGIKSLFSALSNLTDLAALEIVLADFVDFGLTKLPKDIDLSFIDGDVVAGLLPQDLIVLGEVVVNLVDAGLLDILNGIAINQFNYDALNEVPQLLTQVQILGTYATDLFATLVNFGLDKANFGFEPRYTGDDFAGISDDEWVADGELLGDALVNIVKALEIILKEEVTIDAIKAFINDKSYLQASNLPNEAFDVLFEGLSQILSLETIGVMLPDFVEFGLSKLPKSLDTSFLDVNAVSENLPQDILVIGDIAVQAKEFGALTLINGGDLFSFKLQNVAKVIDLLEEMYIFNAYRPNWWAQAIQKLYDALKLGYTVTPQYFSSITEDMWKADNEQLQTIILSLGNILTNENNLNSTRKVKEFIEDKMYADQDFLFDVLLSNKNIDAVAYTVSELFKLNIIDAIETDLVNFGVGKLEDVVGGLDIAFVKDAITKEVLSHDIYNIAAIAKAAKEAGLIEYIRTKDIVDLSASKLAPIFDQINEMLLFKSQRNSWMALIGNALSKFALNNEISYEPIEFGILSDEDCNAAIESVKAILTNVDQILAQWQIESISELIDFIKGNGYQTAGNLTDEVVYIVTELVTHVADIVPLQPLLPKLASFGISKLPENIDLQFVNAYIENGTLNGAALAQDIQTLMAIVNDAVEFGGLELFFGDYDKDQFEINFDIVSSVFEKLETLNLLAVDYSSWLAFVANMGLEAAKIEATFEAQDFSFMNEELWAEDFENLQTIISIIADLAEENNLTTIGAISFFVENKGFTSAQYITKDNLYTVLDLVDYIFAGNSAKPIYLALADYAVDKFIIEAEGLEDLHFVKDIVNNSLYNGDALVSDIYNITNIARNAIEFGALDLFFEGTMGEIELGYVENIFAHLQSIQLFALDRPEWTAFIFNTVFELAKIPGHVDASEYQHMTEDYWYFDYLQRISFIRILDELLDGLHIETLDDALSFVKDKKYQLAQYMTEENIITASNLIAKLSFIETLTPVFDDLALFAVQKVKGIDLEFIKDAILTNELSDKDIASDFVAIAIMIEYLVDFGVVEYYFYQSMDEINLMSLANAVYVLEELCIYTVAKEHWLVLGVNQLMKAIQVDKEFVASDFDGIDVDYEIEHLCNIIVGLDTLLKAVNVKSTDDLNNFINDKLYFDGQYLNEENLEIVVDIIDEVASMGVTRLILPAIASWGVGKIKGDDLDFLQDALENDVFTSDELIGDLFTIIDIAYILIDLGIADIAFDIPVEQLNGDLVAAVVDELDEINLITKLNPNWVSLGLNKALASLNITVNLYELEAFTPDMWTEDNEYLQEAVIALADAINVLGINSISAMKSFLSEGYLETTTYSDDLLAIYNEVLENVISTNTVGLIFDDLLDFVITKAAEGGFDIEFIRAYSRNSFVQDLPTILNIAKSLVAFGALEYIKDKEISNIDVQHLANVVAELENLALFNEFRPEWASLLINKLGGEKLGVEVSASDLDLLQAEWLEDNATMQALVLKLGEILDNNNLNSYSDVVTFFVDDKKYTLEETYTDSNLALISDALQYVLSLNTVDVIFPQLVDMAIEAAKNVKLDLSFLATSVTMNNVKNDVSRLIKMFRPLAKFGLFELIADKHLTFINLEYLNPIIDEFENLEIYNISPANWAASIVNCIAYHANLGFTVLPSDFSSVVWSKENELLQTAITALDQFLVETDLVLISNLQALIENKFAPQEQYANNYSATLLLNAIESVINLQTVSSISDLLVNLGLEKLADSGIDLTILVEGVTNAQIVEDVRTIILAAKDLLEFNIIDILYKGAEINYDQRDLVFNALEKVFGLNMLEGKDTVVVANILDKFEFDTADLRAGNIELDDELVTIEVIVDYLVEVLEMNGLYTLSAISSFDFGSILKINSETNTYLRIVADILFELSKDQFVKLAYRSLSEKLVGDKLAGLADVHNIYPDGTSLSEDLVDLGRVLHNLASLNINGFINENADYPINQKVYIDQIINKLFGLHYFNLPGRMASFLNGLESAINFDLGSVDGNNIKLAEDADDIIAMYHYLEAVLGQESFPIKNKQDIENKVGVKLSFFFEKENFENEIKAIESYMNTTIYDETGALILVLLVPVLKNALPEYWAVLDLDNYNSDKISHDVEHYQGIFEIIMEMDPIEMYNGSVAFANLGDDIKEIINHLLSLELLNNKGNALVELLLSDFVYYGKLKGYDIAGGTFDIASVNFDNEGVLLGELVDQIIDLFMLEGVHNINEIKSYFETFKLNELINDQVAVEQIAQIIETITEFDLVKYNLQELYNIFAVPQLEKANILQYVDYRQSNNDELVAEINYLADAVTILAEIGLGDILSGANINFDQADKVEELLTIIGKMKYAEYHTDTFIDKYELTFRGLLTYDATYADLDIPGDLNKIAQAYRELVPMLTDPNFVIKNTEDFKAVHKGTFVDNIKDHIDQVVKAYEYIAQTSLAPYFYPTVVEKAKGMVPASLSFISDLLTVEELTFAQVQSDVLVSARLVKDLVDANVVEYLTEKTGLIPAQDVAEALINDVFDMYIFNTKFSAILEALMNKLEVSPINVEYDQIDWVADKDILISQLPSIYEIFDTLNIVTINDVLALRNVISSVSNIKEYILDNINSYNARIMLEVMSNLLDTTVAKEIGLNLSKKVLTKVQFSGKLAEFNTIIKLTKYDKETFNKEAKDGIALLDTFVVSGLYENVLDRNLAIDWNNANIETMIRQFVELQLLPLYGQEIVEVIGSIIGINLSTFDNTNVDYAGEQDAYVAAYKVLAEMLSADGFALRSMNDFISFLRRTSDVRWTYFTTYTRLHTILDAFAELAGTGLANEGYKLVMSKLANSGLPAAEYLDVTNMDRALQDEDYVTFINMAKSAVDFIYNDGLFGRNGIDSSIENIEAAQEIVDYFMDLHLFDGLYSDLVLAFMLEFNIDTVEVNLSFVDYEQEAELVKEGIYEVITALNEYGITSAKELYRTIKEFYNTLRSSEVQFLKDVKDMLIKIDVEHIIKVVELCDESKLLAQIILPTYNKFVEKFVPAKFKSYLELYEFKNIYVEEDIHFFAQGLRKVYDSELHTVYTQNRVLNASELALCQEGIKLFGQMRVLEYKKADVIAIIDRVIPQLDLSKLDVDTIVVSEEFEVIADMLPALHNLYVDTNRFYFSISMIGDETITNAIIEVYELALTSKFIRACLPSMFRNIVIKTVQSALGTNRYDDVSDEQILNMFDDGVDALYALREMGVFSNNGIDLTDKSLTDRVFAVVTNNVNLGKYSKYVTKLMNNIHEYGVLPVDWSLIVPTKTELRTLIEIAKQALNFYKTYASDLTSFNLSIVADAQFEQDFMDLLNTTLESQFVNQIFMNVVRGTSRIVTKNYGKLEFGANMTTDEFVTIAIPDLFDMMGYVVDLGVFSGKLDYKNIDALINLAKLGVNSPATKDFVNDIVPYAIKKILKVNITKADLVAANVDYDLEVSYLEAFLYGIEDELQAIELGNANTLLATDFLVALADAGKELQHSKVLEIIIKPVLKKAISMISSATDMFEFMNESIDSEHYTNELAMEDYVTLLDIIKLTATLNIFETMDLSVLTANIEQLLEKLFALHASEGHEATIMRNILDNCSFIDTAHVDLEGIQDWDAEIDDFVAAVKLIESTGLLVPGADIAAKVVTMDETDVAEFLLAFNKSEILRPLIADIAYTAIVTASTAIGFDQTLVEGIIQTHYTWLYNQANDVVPMDTEVNYEIEIAKIAEYIADPLSLLI